VVRTTGPMAKTNPFRFSTKFQDDESDLLYYGYRYYKASTGTWSNRDPLDERGFEFMVNRPKKTAQTQETVHLQEGLNERLAANPLLAMKIQDRLAQMDEKSTTKIDPSAGNPYTSGTPPECPGDCLGRIPGVSRCSTPGYFLERFQRSPRLPTPVPVLEASGLRAPG
jgi:RHS repeat-associated protein